MITGETGNWYHIEFNNTTAYVSKDYITFTASTPEVVKKTGYVYNLDGALLNVRPKTFNLGNSNWNTNSRKLCCDRWGKWKLVSNRI